MVIYPEKGVKSKFTLHLLYTVLEDVQTHFILNDAEFKLKFNAKSIDSPRNTYIKKKLNRSVKSINLVLQDFVGNG